MNRARPVQAAGCDRSECDLVCADVNEAADTIATRGLQHDVRAQDVGLGELQAVAERVVDV
jgi:hypothetical protein